MSARTTMGGGTWLCQHLHTLESDKHGIQTFLNFCGNLKAVNSIEIVDLKTCLKWKQQQSDNLL